MGSVQTRRQLLVGAGNDVLSPASACVRKTAWSRLAGLAGSNAGPDREPFAIILTTIDRRAGKKSRSSTGARSRRPVRAQRTSTTLPVSAASPHSSR